MNVHEDDFKTPSDTQIRRLWELLRKLEVWVLSSPKVSVAKSLFNTVQEEISTRWTEEVTECKDKEVLKSRNVTPDGDGFWTKAEVDNPQYCMQDRPVNHVNLTLHPLNQSTNRLCLHFSLHSSHHPRRLIHPPFFPATGEKYPTWPRYIRAT